jgi:N-acylneuraminate cytidylyltransferase
MARLCIIPARGGSKRIPNKNIKPFLGKPIIAYSIEIALKSGLFDTVMVSTDDLEIAQCAQKYGAEVPFLRSKENSTDYATTQSVLEEVLEEYSKRQVFWSSLFCIYPTAPLTQLKHIRKGYEILTQSDLDYVYPVVNFSYPIWRGLRRKKSGEVEFIWAENKNSRSQDLEEVYHDAGQWYWFNLFNFETSLCYQKNGTILLDNTVVQDIDNHSDWILAEIKYKRLNVNI